MPWPHRGARQGLVPVPPLRALSGGSSMELDPNEMKAVSNRLKHAQGQLAAVVRTREKLFLSLA
ncbi:hypothetical protein GCM10028784_02380 [Myceligenerans cantabricum]